MLIFMNNQYSLGDIYPLMSQPNMDKEIISEYVFCQFLVRLDIL
jgi:hypothetical protein